MHMTMRDWLLLVFLSLLWGGAFFFVGLAVLEVPPLTIVLCRVSIAALCLFAVVRVTGQSLPKVRSVYPAFLVMGLLNNVIPFSLLFWAQTSISSGLAAILNATTPIFSIVIAHLLLSDERMVKTKLFGVCLGVVGVVVLVGGDVISGIGLATLGIVACLCAALSYGLAGVYGRRFGKMGIPSTTVAFGQLAASSLIMLPVALLVDQPWTLGAPSLGAGFAIIALAVVSTALAYVVFFRLLASVGAVNVALVTLLMPMSAILLGATFLDERLEGHHYAGMVLIGAGLLAVDGRLFARRGSASQ